MAQKTFTGAMAILSFQTPTGTLPVQLCDSVSITEKTDVADVTGLGNLYKLDMPVTSWDGSGSFSFFTTPFKEAVERLALDNRIFQTPEQYAEYLLTWSQNDGVDLSIFWRVKQPNGSLQNELFCKIGKLRITNFDFGVDAKQVSKSRYQFMYSHPILLPQ